MLPSTELASSTSYQVIFSMSKFWAPPLVNELISKNNAMDIRSHFKPKDGRAYTCVEDSTIMRAPLRGEYKRGKGTQYGGLTKIK